MNIINFNYKKPDKIITLQLPLTIFALSLFLITKNKIMIVFFSGIYLPHFIVSFLLFPLYILLFISLNIEILFRGKISQNLYYYVSSIFKHFIFTFTGILSLADGYAPFFLQEQNNDYGITIDFQSPHKSKRLLSVLRLSGIVFILCIPQIIIIVLFLPFLITWAFIFIPYSTYKKTIPYFLYTFSKRLIFYVVLTFGFITGLTDNYPPIFPY